MKRVREWCDRLSLKSRMACTVILVVTAALAIAGWAHGRHMAHAARIAVEAQQAAMVDGLAAEVGGKIDALRNQLERMALDTTAEQLADQSRMRERLRALAEYHPLLDDAWAFTMDGRITADFPVSNGRAGLDIRDRDYFRTFAARREFLITEPTVGRFSGQPRVILFAPIHGSHGEVVGAVGGVIRLLSPRLMGRLGKQRIGETGYVGVFTRGGVMLAHPRPERVMEKLESGRNPAVERARAGFSGTLEGVNRDGVPVLYTFRAVPGTPWIAFTALPTAEAFGPLGRELRLLALLIALLSVAGGGAAWFAMSRLLAPLRALEDEMERIAEAPHLPVKIRVARNDEIGRLTTTFNRMVAAQVNADMERALAYEQIHHTGRMFNALYERTPIGMALIRRDGGFIRSNPAFQRLTGYSDEELTAMRECDLGAAESHPAAQRAQEELESSGAIAPYEKEYLARGGMRVPVRVSAVAVRDAGINDCIWLIAEDITQRRQMLDALKESEAEARMLSAVASHSASAVVIAGSDGRIEWANEAFERLTGFGREELIGQCPARLLQGPETDPETTAIMRAAVLARRPFAVEVVNYTKSGRPYWVGIECAPVFDHQGELERFVAIERDVTSAREAARALAESEDKYRRVFETALEVIWQFDSRGLVTMLNPAWERITGLPIAATLGKPFYDLLVPEQREAAHAALSDMLEGRRDVFDELAAFTTASGEPRWFQVRAQAVRDKDGTVRCMGMLHDVHERRLADAARRVAEEALRASQERYQRAIDNASDVVWERDLRADRMFVSDRILDVLRLRNAVTPARVEEVFKLVHPDDLERHHRMVANLTASDTTVEWDARFLTGDGSYRWLRVRGRVVRDAAGTPILTSGTASDVHEARLASEELRAMQVRYQRAIDGSNDGIWERDVRTDMFYLSDRFDEILGHPPGGLPRSREAWLELIHPDDRPVHDASVREMLDSGRAEPWELRFRNAAGEYRWLRLRGLSVRGADGRVTLTSGTASDIHAGKLAEVELKRHRDNLAQIVEERTAGMDAARRDAERAREQAERAREAAESAREAAVSANLAKSEFLANMSHELRTPMHAIISFANFGVEKFDRVESAKLLHYFRNIQKSGSRLLTLLNDLLDLSKLEAGKMMLQFQRVDLAELAGEAVSEYEALARSREVALETRVERSLFAHADSMRMLQVLRNLISNAVKFTQPGGTVRVECVQVAAQDCAGMRAAVELRVRDDGIGIPPDELDAVFDKFVQSSKTKTGAGGTGLGLAICREIVTAHGGYIFAANNPPPERGALFVVRLPDALPARREPRARDAEAEAIPLTS